MTAVVNSECLLGIQLLKFIAIHVFSAVTDL